MSKISHREEQVEWYLESANRWYMPSPDVFVAGFLEFDGHVQRNDVSRSALEHCHPLLPSVIEALLDGHVPFAKGDLVSYSLRLLRGEGLKCEDARGRVRQFCSVDDLRFSDVTTEAVWVSGILAATKVINVGGAEATYATSASHEMLGMSREALHARYPGWEQRYHAGRLLELERFELMRQVFTTTPACHIEMPNVDLTAEGP